MLALEMAAFFLSGQWKSATVTVTPVISGAAILPPASPRYKSWLINCADSDTLIVFPHGFLTQPGSLQNTPPAPIAPDDVRVAAPIPTVANAALANWGITADATNIYLAKQSAVGSGASPALKVVAEHPHTFIR